MNESFATPAALRKAQREVAEFQRSQHLGQQLVASIKDLCPSPGGGGRGRLDIPGKKAVAIHQEITREINLLLTRIFAQRHKTGEMDLQAVELALCASLHQAGTTALTALLAFDPPSWEQRQLPCACGHTARYVELRSKPVLTAVGKAECLRPLLPVRALASWSVSGGCRARRREHGTVPAGAACRLRSATKVLSNTGGQAGLRWAAPSVGFNYYL